MSRLVGDDWKSRADVPTDQAGASQTSKSRSLTTWNISWYLNLVVILLADGNILKYRLEDVVLHLLVPGIID